jgi:hypothetical protein
MVAGNSIEPTWQTKLHGIERIAQSAVNWSLTLRWRASWRVNSGCCGHHNRSQAG